MANANTDLRGEVAVITGAASGIGFALATEAARRGMSVALADLGGDHLEAARDAVEALGAAAIAVPTDVRDLAAVEALRDRTKRSSGRLGSSPTTPGSPGSHSPGSTAPPTGGACSTSTSSGW